MSEALSGEQVHLAGGGTIEGGAVVASTMPDPEGNKV